MGEAVAHGTTTARRSRAWTLGWLAVAAVLLPIVLTPVVFAVTSAWFLLPVAAVAALAAVPLAVAAVVVGRRDARVPERSDRALLGAGLGVVGGVVAVLQVVQAVRAVVDLLTLPVLP